MRMSELLGRREKEVPREAQLISHQFLLRGGFVRQVGSGLFSLLPPALRIVRKIEAIIREEMDGIDGQEVLMPVVLPRELWEESGRYDLVGSELLRFKDRTGKDHVLGMTHEEAVVHLARSETFSYRQFPFLLYQIQTKFRDEPRSRGGLIRVREFTMKDAYSFHRDEACLLKTYGRAHQAYERIFKRVGLKHVLSVESDSGMMGGGISHEFMLITPAGEDSLLVCESCDYRANREVATTRYPEFAAAAGSREKLATPAVKSIEDVAKFLKVSHDSTCKAVFYVGPQKELILVCLRGDLEVNEAKLRKAIQISEWVPADDALIREHGMVPGYASPLGTDTSRYRLVMDESLRGRSGLVTGANEEGYHIKGVDLGRELEGSKLIWSDVATVVEGFACPKCDKSLKLVRGIEIGNIFQLGKKYTEKMGMNYLDEQGKSQIPTMGCYGIGVGRLMASVLEESHDEHGPIWPASIAPYQIHINILDIKKEGVQEAGEKLYRTLSEAGLEVLVDDRGEKPGFQFLDADLLGIPWRVIVSPKTLAQNSLELRSRASRDSELVPLERCVEALREKIASR